MPEPTTHPTPSPEQRALAALQLALSQLRECKPNDRSNLDRVYAVTITDVEKAFAFFSVYSA